MDDIFLEFFDLNLFKSKNGWTKEYPSVTVSLNMFDAS